MISEHANFAIHSWQRWLLLKSGILTLGILVVLWAGWPASSLEDQDRFLTSIVASGSSIVRKVPAKPTAPVTTRLNLNTSSRSKLETLPGIGVVLADRIVHYRATYGSFTHIDDLVNVSGIGEKRLRKLKPFVTVDHLIRDMKG